MRRVMERKTTVMSLTSPPLILLSPLLVPDHELIMSPINH